MKFSVIMPCRNAGPWVAAALRSIGAQTHRAHEILVVDDGSTDDSVAQIQSCGVAVRLIHVQRHNAAAARNAAINVATGDWLALLDADDLWYPNHLARAAELLSSSGDVAFMALHDWIDMDGKPIPLPTGFRWPLAEPTTGIAGAEFVRYLADQIHFGHSSVVYRRDLVCAVGGFDETQVRRHDLDLWLRVVKDRTWAFDTVRSMGYREATPGSLSKDHVVCERYYLRCLTRHANDYPMPEMQRLIATSARQAMSLAFVDGTTADLADVQLLAWPHLPWSYRLAYRFAQFLPTGFRVAIRGKRWWFQRQQQAAASVPEAAGAAPLP